jgi:uncharacterized protein with PIN domain
LVTIFADASAIVALIAVESDALALADCLHSALPAWEAVASLC